MMGGGPDKSLGEDKKEVLLVLLPIPYPTAYLDPIKKRFPRLEVEYINVAHTEGLETEAAIPADAYKRATVIATVSALPPSESAAPNLGLVQCYMAGINHLMKHPIYTDSKIPICTATGIHGPQVAEWIFMSTLIQSHRYNFFYEGQKRHAWERDLGGSPVRDLVDQRVGVLGYGSIGRQVARVAQALGMDVIAYTASPRTTPESKKDTGFIVPGTGDPEGAIPSQWFSGTSKEDLHEFLKQGIDLLVLSVPLTPSTQHFLSTPEFDILAASNPHLTTVANIARGDLIDQPALVTALKANKLRGAVLDVASPEPLPPDDPLWGAPNVLITPHVSWNSSRYMERAFQVLAENLGRRERGEKYVNEVRRGRGY